MVGNKIALVEQFSYIAQYGPLFSPFGVFDGRQTLSLKTASVGKETAMLNNYQLYEVTLQGGAQKVLVNLSRRCSKELY